MYNTKSVYYRSIDWQRVNEWKKNWNEATWQHHRSMILYLPSSFLSCACSRCFRPYFVVVVYSLDTHFWIFCYYWHHTQSTCTSVTASYGKTPTLPFPLLLPTSFTCSLLPPYRHLLPIFVRLNAILTIDRKNMLFVLCLTMLNRFNTLLRRLTSSIFRWLQFTFSIIIA